MKRALPLGAERAQSTVDADPYEPDSDLAIAVQRLQKPDWIYSESAITRLITRKQPLTTSAQPPPPGWAEDY